MRKNRNNRTIVRRREPSGVQNYLRRFRRQGTRSFDIRRTAFSCFPAGRHEISREDNTVETFWVVDSVHYVCSFCVLRATTRAHMHLHGIESVISAQRILVCEYIRTSVPFCADQEQYVGSRSRGEVGVRPPKGSKTPAGNTVPCFSTGHERCKHMKAAPGSFMASTPCFVILSVVGCAPQTQFERLYVQQQWKPAVPPFKT